MPEFEEIDKTQLTFGKYQGDTPLEVSQIDPDYIVWMYENMDDPPCSEELYEACVEGEVEDLLDKMGGME